MRPTGRSYLHRVVYQTAKRTIKVDEAIGFVVAGHQMQRHLHELFKSKEQEYFLCDSEINHPRRIDHDYSHAPRAWAEDVSDLTPTVSATFDPSSETREQIAEKYRRNGEYPEMFEGFDQFLATNNFDAVVVSSPNDFHAEWRLGLLARDIIPFVRNQSGRTSKTTTPEASDAERGGYRPFTHPGDPTRIPQ